ncbi:PREDICTED: protein SUPPRESSOR OF K(+) TRANSPORT GROWTH DEFECT 1-like isoform X2 [Nicotiana attenuata]|uniref:protein SUPPRESSOR OF K(+) TRANSPORT GROWTH DEFECT 1-like isoform X2 n=1 Tax=Nicotiana attenuata TaxID=49451 RepID=UPI00090486D1|nr:PREDICTED: protein SUPPRESSOR OF K(+) TRANSPORT GROWTH DEFECT 1-like isoform X2 [Nicotiana attenuata]
MKVVEVGLVQMEVMELWLLSPRLGPKMVVKMVVGRILRKISLELGLIRRLLGRSLMLSGTMLLDWKVLNRLCRKLLFCLSSSLSSSQARGGHGELFFYMVLPGQESLTWPKLLLLKQNPHFLVGECQLLFSCSVSSSDLVSKWMGESEKLVSNLFQMARESAPSIIFVDEIDSLCGQRGEGNESEASRRIKTELLVQMQGVGHNDDKVLVLAATNTPYALDQAIRRRFDKRIYIPLPDLKARQHMFKVHLGDTPHNLSESDFEDLARKTEGFSGSDISVCVKDVLFEPVRKTQDAMFFTQTSNGTWVPCGPKQPGAVQTTMQELAAKGLASQIIPPPITKTDFDKVLARQRPTVSKSDLEVHDRFTKEFGEEG